MIQQLRWLPILVGMLLALGACGDSGSSENGADAASTSGRVAGADQQMSEPPPQSRFDCAARRPQRPEIKPIAAELNVLRRGNGAEPGTLDPHLAEGVTASNVLRDIYEGLIVELPDGQLSCGVASAVDISEDGQTYTFTLRENARWSNGQPVTAEHFVYSLRRAVNPLTGSTYSDVLSPIKNAAEIIASKLPVEELGVAALEDGRLQIQLGNVTPYFLGLLAHSTAHPVYPPAVEQFGKQFVRPENVVNNGAYKLTEWVIRSHIKLARNSHYWDNANTAIDRVEYFPIEDAAAEANRFLADELDFAGGGPSSERDRLKSMLGDQFKVFDILGTYYFELNLADPLLGNNPQLRQALSLAIDRDVIINLIGKLDQLPAYSWVPPNTLNSQFYQPKYASWTQAQRDEEAKRLFAAAGAPKNLQLSVLYNTSEDHKKVVLVMADMWKKKLGLRVSLANQEWKVFLKTRDQGDFQIARAGWLGDYNDPYTFMEIFRTDHGQNNTDFRNADYERLVAEATQMVDLQQRAKKLAEAEAILIAEAPLIPLYFYRSARMVKPWLKGFTPNLLSHFYSKDFWIER